MMYLGAMVLAIVATTVYHLFTRSIPAGVHPLVSIIITYLTAILICLALLPFFPLDASLGESLRRVNWASFAVGLAIVGIEMGFLLAYRAGWNISLAALIANVAVTVILLPVGLLAFKERLTSGQVIGMVLCVAGLILVNRR